MNHPITRVDDDGVHFGEAFSGSADVVFDDHRGWSFQVDRDEPGFTVPWPKRLRRHLEGVARVRVVSDDTELYDAEVAFGSGEGRVELVDPQGIPIIVDKWGLIQRPFEGRREAGVVEVMVDMAERILQVMREDCGIDGWISFGTLLGAAREGKVIGHDSDIDLCFLSERGTPAEMTAELWGIARALRDRGMRVDDKSASFITIRFDVPDGGMGGIDVYTTFFLDGLLYETATVRTEVPRSAVLPLTELTFEGRPLPAPADPDTMLSISYGPGWRTPDPSFRHQPGPEIVERFDGWFGSLMRSKRDWAALHRNQSDEERVPSDFQAWVGERLEPGTRVVDVGCGNGADLLAHARAGHPGTGLDYALPRKALRRAAREEDLDLEWRDLNLYDGRDVLTTGAELARRKATRAVTAREVLECLDDDGVEHFWRLASMTLRGGGTAYVEGRALSPRDAAQWRATQDGGAVRSRDPHALAEAARAAGGVVRRREGFAAAARAVRGGEPARWRMIVDWPQGGRRAGRTRASETPR